MAKTYLELKAEAEKLLKQAEELRAAEVAQVIEEIKEKLTQYGLTTADLEPRKKASGKKSSGHVAAKYRSPTGEEWSGRGRAPRWLTAAIEQGKKKKTSLFKQSRPSTK